MKTAQESEEQRSTPGPWVQFADKGHTVAIMPAMRDGDVCVFAEPYPSNADARLIARAPSLLALLKELIAIEGPQPGHVMWARKVKEEIETAERGAGAQEVCRHDGERNWFGRLLRCQECGEILRDLDQESEVS